MPMLFGVTFLDLHLSLRALSTILFHVIPLPKFPSASVHRAVFGLFRHLTSIWDESLLAQAIAWEQS
jgi:hypothetical protein